MKNKKRVLFISGIITTIGIIGLIIVQFRLYELLGFYGGTIFLSNLRQFGIATMGGLFTGALVTFLISVSEYRTERTEALENLYFAAEELEREFSKIKFFIPDEPRELVQNVLGEIDNNKSIIEQNANLREAVLKLENQDSADEIYNRGYLKLEYEAQNAFKDYIWNHTDERIQSVFENSCQKKKYLDEECDKKIQKYGEQLEETMRTFLKFQDVNTHYITAAYGKIDFLFANKSIRSDIVYGLYKKLWDEINFIKDCNYHFDLYFSGKGGNRAVQCSFIWDLQDSLISEDDDYYYRQFDFDIATKMIRILYFVNGKSDKITYPEKKIYKLCAKPGYFESLKKRLSKDNGNSI